MNATAAVGRVVFQQSPAECVSKKAINEAFFEYLITYGGLKPVLLVEERTTEETSVVQTTPIS